MSIRISNDGGGINGSELGAAEAAEKVSRLCCRAYAVRMAWEMVGPGESFSYWEEFAAEAGAEITRSEWARSIRLLGGVPGDDSVAAFEDGSLWHQHDANGGGEHYAKAADLLALDWENDKTLGPDTAIGIYAAANVFKRATGEEACSPV